MLDKIWRFLKQLIKRVFRTFSQDFNPPWPPLGKGGKQEETNLASPLSKGGQRGVPPTLTDAEYETKLMELLEGVNEGWGTWDVAEFLLAKRIKNGDLAAWLRRFGSRLLEGGHGDTAATDAVVSLQELARRLELLGRVAGNWERLRGMLVGRFWLSFRYLRLRGMRLAIERLRLGKSEEMSSII